MELARALVADPVLLLADEPSSGLDIHETRELSHVLRMLQRERGMAVLLVEHDLGMVGSVVDRTIVMNLGEVIAEGTLRRGDGRSGGPPGLPGGERHDRRSDRGRGRPGGIGRRIRPRRPWRSTT